MKRPRVARTSKRPSPTVAGLAAFALAASCVAAPPVATPPPPPADESAAAPQSSPEVAAPQTSPAAAAPPDSPASARVPNWTHNGSSNGVMVLRCENAFPPEDGSGKCMCEGYQLDVCADGVRQLSIDRKQCGFACKPTAQSAKRVALRCPDGAAPEASAGGCACSGRKPLDPCAGGIESAQVVSGQCVVTCKKDQ